MVWVLAAVVVLAFVATWLAYGNGFRAGARREAEMYAARDEQAKGQVRADGPDDWFDRR
jgi:hypothetical protein